MWHTRWRNGGSMWNRASNMHCLHATSTKHIFFPLFFPLVSKCCMIYVHKLANRRRAATLLGGGGHSLVCSKTALLSFPFTSLVICSTWRPMYLTNYCITKTSCTKRRWCFSHHCFHFLFFFCSQFLPSCNSIPSPGSALVFIVGAIYHVIWQTYAYQLVVVYFFCLFVCLDYIK